MKQITSAQIPLSRSDRCISVFDILALYYESELVLSEQKSGEATFSQTELN